MTYNIFDGKSVAAKRFTRTLNNKIYKFMTSVSKNVYIDKLGDIVKKSLTFENIWEFQNIKTFYLIMQQNLT